MKEKGEAEDEDVSELAADVFAALKKHGGGLSAVKDSITGCVEDGD